MAQNKTRNGNGKGKRLTLRDLPLDTHKALKRRAALNDRSMNEEAVLILRRSLNRQRAAA